MQPTLAILAGGKGTRLGGRDKGQLVCEGRTLLDRLLDLGALCSEVLIVKDDLVPGKGAPGGVVTALMSARSSHVLIVACDMPWVTPQAIAPLLAARAAAIFEDEPFPGLYPATLGPVWRDRLVSSPSMRELLASEPFLRLPLRDPRVVRSVNTPEDAKSLGVDMG